MDVQLPVGGDEAQRSSWWLDKRCTAHVEALASVEMQPIQEKRCTAVRYVEVQPVP